MTYITVKQSPMYHQMSLEEFLFENSFTPTLINANTGNTRTYETEFVSPKFMRHISVSELIAKLMEFNRSTESLRAVSRPELYRTFYIPKKSGGLRRIDAPNDELMNALRTLKTMFETDFYALYHTSAYAYIGGRSTVDALKKHQQNESKWFAKFDLSDFFGSTTLDHTMKMLSMVFPFSEVAKNEAGRQALEKAVELAFLNGGLPQGTPLSPLLTTIIMIPIDYKLTKALRDFNHQRYVYTRYADDFLVSSKYDFNFRRVEKLISDTLAEFEAPFKLKAEKTRYGSSAGSNWNLGLMLNKDNQITVGHKNKKQFQAMLVNYIMDKKNGTQWELNDIQTMEGYRNYYRMIEGETIDRIVEHINRKFSVHVVDMIKSDLRV